MILRCAIFLFLVSMGAAAAQMNVRTNSLPVMALYVDELAHSPKRPETAYSLASKGYDAYAAKDYSAAARAFEGSLALDPDQPTLAAQLAYTHKTLGDNRKAARWFRHAVAYSDGPVDYSLRREVQFAENSLDASAYMVWRDNALDGSALAAAGPSLTQSQGGVEGTWTPPVIGDRNGRKLRVFGRILWGFEGNTLNVQKESYQAGLGIRYRPFREHNLVLTGERLVSIGDFARDDWMLRASYSWDKGFRYYPKRDSWDYITFYADAAVIEPASPDVFLLTEGRYGRSFRIAGGEYGAGWVLTPHITTAAMMQHDDFSTTTLVEAGGGLSLKLWFADSPARAHSASAELLIQWRGKIAGDSAGPSGFLSTLVLQF